MKKIFFMLIFLLFSYGAVSGGTVKFYQFQDCGCTCDTISTKEECDTCPDREYKNGKCIEKCKGRQFHSIDGCINCNKLSLHQASREECEECSNRENYNIKGINYCKLKECPKGYIHDIYVGCQYCNRTIDNDRIHTTQEECNKCPNAMYIKGLSFCVNSKRELNTFWTSTYGNVSCDENDGYETTKEECLRCPNRYYEPYNKDTEYEIGKCFLRGGTKQMHPKLTVIF